MNTKMTAIYIRIANPSNPDGFAAVVQRESLIRYAKEHGYDNTVCYEDIGFNGLTLTDRPSFQKMQDDIDTGKVQTVIVRSESRVGRNTADIARWVSDIRSKGVDFISIVHPTPSVDSLLRLCAKASRMAVTGRL